jgi:ubiquitin-protein ligase
MHLVYISERRNFTFVFRTSFRLFMEYFSKFSRIFSSASSTAAGGTDHQLGDGESWTMEDLGSRSSPSQNDSVGLLQLLLEEYRQMADHLPSSMLVVPSCDTLLEWHGVLFIKDGRYRSGVFKFILDIPVDYPYEPPVVRFLTPVHHPLVDPETGDLDISPAFPQWKSGRDYIVLVLAFVKKIFYKKELIGGLDQIEIDDCVEESLRLLYINNEYCPTPFLPWRSRGVVPPATAPTRLSWMLARIYPLSSVRINKLICLSTGCSVTTSQRTSLTMRRRSGESVHQ